MAEPQPTTADYDQTTRSIATHFSKLLGELIEPTFMEASATTVRLRGADSRQENTILAGSGLGIQQEIEYLAALGASRFTIRLSYPVFDTSDYYGEERIKVYETVGSLLRTMQIESILTVGPQVWDDEYLWGHPLKSECDGLLPRLVDTARGGIRTLDPAYVIIDLSPVTLTNSDGCERERKDAAQTALATLRALKSLEPDTRFGFAVDIVDSTDYLSELLDSDQEFFVALRTDGFFDQDPHEQLRLLDSLASKVRQEGHEVAVSSFWFHKTDPFSGNSLVEPSVSGASVLAQSDAASLWRSSDAHIGPLARQLEQSSKYLFVGIKEPGLWSGAYLETDRLRSFDRANGDVFHNMSIADRLGLSAKYRQRAAAFLRNAHKAKSNGANRGD